MSDQAISDRTDDSEVYAVFIRLENGGEPECICGPFAYVAIAEELNKETGKFQLAVIACDEHAVYTEILGWRTDGGWRIAPHIDRQSTFYDTVEIRSTIPPGHPARERAAEVLDEG
jgi:hypothetical protein